MSKTARLITVCYCNEAVFLSPRHLTALFGMASTQTGLYRTVHRQGAAGSYDLFTFILHLENELAHASSEGSTWGDDYWSYLDAVAALDVVVDHHLGEIDEWPSSQSKRRYKKVVRIERARYREAWPRGRNLTEGGWVAEQISVPQIGVIEQSASATHKRALLRRASCYEMGRRNLPSRRFHRRITCRRRRVVERSGKNSVNRSTIAGSRSCDSSPLTR